ncbi:hypothetical protein [Altererythrobacter sp. GH1-8]|uniref:hypothetical protein n=1 Tax=Altererythrobacter sp. GH1-8 TaxID=3349333 RepID=UPI00374DDA77
MTKKGKSKEAEFWRHLEHDPDGLAYALEVARGMKSDSLERRDAAEKIWLAIADNEASEGTKISWVEYIAKRLKKDLLKNDSLDDRQRGSAALNAIGLSYRKDEGYELREFVSNFLDLEDLMKPANEVQKAPKPMQLVRMLREQGLLLNVEDRAAQQRVRRALRKELEKRQAP